MTTFTTRRHVPHPPQRVWEALTRADLLAGWFMHSSTDLADGASFQLHDPDARGWSGRLDCRVEEFVKHQRLRYRATEVDGSSVTTLQWTLVPSEAGTDLTLVHSGWQGARGWLTGMALKIGWGSLLRSKLPTVLAGVAREG